MSKGPESVNYLIKIKDFSNKLVEDRKEQRKAVKQYLDDVTKEIIGKYSEIEVNHSLWLAQALVATSKKEDFEKLFQVTLTYETRNYNNINTGSDQISDWVMHGIPKIPSDIESVVKYVELDKKVFLTD